MSSPTIDRTSDQENRLSRSNYDKFPTVVVPGENDSAVAGWNAVAARLLRAITALPGSHHTVVVECYPGLDEKQLATQFQLLLSPAGLIAASDALLPKEKINALLKPYLGGDDPVFGFWTDLKLPQFFDVEKLQHLQQELHTTGKGITLVVGCGASLVAEGDLLIYADLARWEIQRRFRRGETGNLGADNNEASAAVKYKRAFFVDWRVADEWKKHLLPHFDFLLDSHELDLPKLVEGDALRRGWQHAVTRPFRVVPFFDPAPWGGQWMKETCALPENGSNYGWCFDCVPEENSLLLQFGDVRVESPASNLVFMQPMALLGQSVRDRFGDEFPIRFDFLDTIDGGNLSLQVHPLTEYIRDHFGLTYTQDESYYMLDARSDAAVYLGLREGIEPAEMLQQLESANTGGAPFPAEKFVNQFPARKHDHFLIPAGTVHCSGRNAMVLEISATPYIFTFKMWDWARPGLDGKMRPIHLEHAVPNIQWDRTTTWVRKNLVNDFQPLDHGEGWRAERTGLHESEFIETRRHWFTKTVFHDTEGRVNVLNLVEGDAAVVESPTGAFEPYIVHYAETFILPAAVGLYSIRPLDPRREHATMKAFVR